MNIENLCPYSIVRREGNTNVDTCTMRHYKPCLICDKTEYKNCLKYKEVLKNIRGEK